MPFVFAWWFHARQVVATRLPQCAVVHPERSCHYPSMDEELNESELLVLKLAEGDDTPFATLGARGLIGIERITELPAADRTDVPISPLTPDVRSTRRLRGVPHVGDDASRAIDDASNWRPLEAVPARQWYAVTSTPETMRAYRRAWEAGPQ